jgi:hypothetical protein
MPSALNWTRGATGFPKMVHYAVLLLESIFFIGLAGSLVVAVLAFVGDIHVFFDKDKPEGSSRA